MNSRQGLRMPPSPQSIGEMTAVSRDHVLKPGLCSLQHQAGLGWRDSGKRGTALWPLIVWLLLLVKGSDHLAHISSFVLTKALPCSCHGNQLGLLGCLWCDDALRSKHRCSHVAAWHCSLPRSHCPPSSRGQEGDEQSDSVVCATVPKEREQGGGGAPHPGRVAGGPGLSGSSDGRRGSLSLPSGSATPCAFHCSTCTRSRRMRAGSATRSRSWSGWKPSRGMVM